MIAKLKHFSKNVLIKFGLKSPRFEDVLRMSRGVVHVGGNTGQEREVYDRFGLQVLWIEPIDSIFHDLVRNISTFPRQKAFKALLTDEVEGKALLHIASNGGASSSIFDFQEHKIMWPEVDYCGELEMATSTLDDLILKGNVDVVGFDLLVMDVQGAELLVLKGAETFLRQVSYIRLEAADFNAYDGGTNRAEIVRYLDCLQFQEISAESFASRQGLGTYYDLIFKRKRSGSRRDMPV
jgi:FkbM family methyltransferase